MTDMAKQLMLVVAALVVAVVVIFLMWPRHQAEQAPDAKAAQRTERGGKPILSTEEMLARRNEAARADRTDGAAAGAEIEPARRPESRAASEPDAAAALKLYERGQKLVDAGKLIEARTVVSEALFTNRLPAAKAAAARKLLTSLAENTLFSPGLGPADPYVFRYTVKAADRLSLVERKLKLHVPTRILVKINRLESANMIRAGQTLKMIKGPYHAVISLSNFTMDMYLKREGLPYIFIKRVPVGVGKQGTTPIGSWRVGLGKKMIKPPWNPPPNSERRGTILYGQPGYAFGKKGLWIGLEGTDRKTRSMKGYGLHSTDEPNSVGTEVSLGCIRLRDDDMELAFSLLYEKWSTVIIKK